jgi:hypothetical protein
MAEMYLIQILLPVIGAQSDRPDPYEMLREELTSRFGGMTFHKNAPAEGLWANDDDVEKDAIIIAEVMIDDLHRDWWHTYRKTLEDRFQQEEIVIRALPMARL